MYHDLAITGEEEMATNSISQALPLRGGCNPSVTRVFRERIRRFLESSGENENKFAFALPNDADLLACFYSLMLRADPLEHPLRRLLLDAVRVPALQAVTLAVWKEPDMPYDFSIYALGDLAWQQDHNPPPPDRIECGQKLYLEVNRSYSPLKQIVEAQVPHILSSLWFINTNGTDVADILPTLKGKLTSDDTFDFRGGGELIYFYSAIITNRKAAVPLSD
jgi:hypothetical protein